MNDFRNKQSKRRNSVRKSIDGFGQPRRTSQASGSKSAAGLSGNAGKIDNFKGKEGFTSRNRQRSLTPATPKKLDIEPVVISKTEPARRKKRFARLRRLVMGNKRPMTRRRKITLGITALIVFLMLVFGILILKGYINLNKILGGGGGAAALDTNVDPSKLRGEGDGRVNILMLGRGGDNHEGSDLTDTIIIASIDPIAKEAALVSLPRDLYVPVTDHGSMKINAVYATGKNASLRKESNWDDAAKHRASDAGYSMLEQTIEKNLGLPIHYRTMVDFEGFKKSIDTVGGIDINAPDPVRETMRIDGKTYNLDVKQGWQHMDGFKALAYSRSRYTSVRGDFDRSERQRAVLIALKNKTMSAGTYSNPAKISSLMDNLGNHVQTNFSLQDLSRLYQLGKEIDSSKISSIGLADPPNNYVITSNIGGQSVVVPRAGIGNFKEIQGYLRNTLKDSFIRDENASITVLNGTNTTGLATTKADELRSYGYNIGAIGNAPKRDYQKTILVDMRGGSKKYTKNYLEKRFGIGAVTSLPDSSIQPGTADFVIILGSDQAAQ
jgi:LCP family protein required for cell wall assembly